MELTKFVTDNQRQSLAEARQRYGDLRELSVSAEELCELAIVCNKFCRYETKEHAQEKLHKAVLTEVADVLIVLDHIVNIFDIQEPELHEAVGGKINRLRHWLNTPGGLEVSTKDREIPVQQILEPEKISCGSCKHYKDFTQHKPPNGACIQCVRKRQHVGDRPMYQKREAE